MFFTWSLGGALVEMGESMKRLAEIKDSLDIDVKQNFIDPFQTIIDKDLKDIQVENCNHTKLNLENQFYRISVVIIKTNIWQWQASFRRFCVVPQHHLKKLEGRRLDYDYKKKRQGKIPDEELRLAGEKFCESKEVAETSMQNLLDTDVSFL